MVEPIEKARNLIPVAAGFEAGLVVLAVVLGALLGVDPLATLVWNRWALAWGLLATVPLFLVLWLIVRLPWPPFRRLIELVDQFLADTLPGATLPQFALVSLMAGIGEETLFRGLAQPLLGELIGSPSAGLVAASLLFGLAHSVTRTYAVLAAIVGAFFGVLWLMSDNLLVPITTHATYDFVALWYLQATAHRRRPNYRNEASTSGGAGP